MNAVLKLSSSIQEVMCMWPSFDFPSYHMINLRLFHPCTVDMSIKGPHKFASSLSIGILSPKLINSITKLYQTKHSQDCSLYHHNFYFIYGWLVGWLLGWFNSFTTSAMSTIKDEDHQSIKI